jgi:hypothetical protein
MVGTDCRGLGLTYEVDDDGVDLALGHECPRRWAMHVHPESADGGGVATERAHAVRAMETQRRNAHEATSAKLDAVLAMSGAVVEGETHADGLA